MVSSTTERIAGAGLAGLTAAVILAEAGRSVEVHEAKLWVSPSSGPHTEGIRNYRAQDALEELRSAGFDVAPFATVTRTVRCSPRHRNVLTGPAHYLFLRGRDPDTVDQMLYGRALAAGVAFRFGTPLPPGEADIVATGPPKDRTSILGAGYRFSAEGSPLTPDTAYALFDNEVAPAGYLAITPGARAHSIYSVSWSEFEYGRLLGRMERALDIPWVKELVGSSRRVDKIHGRAWFAEDPIGTAQRGGSLYVGEAGGFQDAVAGFGFRYAALTGALAARSILEGSDYRELLRAAFGREFQESYAFRATFTAATNDDYDRMVAALGPEMTLAEYVKGRGPRGF